MFPPEILLKDCVSEDYEGSTYKDVIEYTLDVKESLNKCNEDKKSIRKWKEENQTKSLDKK